MGGTNGERGGKNKRRTSNGKAFQVISHRDGRATQMRPRETAMVKERLTAIVHKTRNRENLPEGKKKLGDVKSSKKRFGRSFHGRKKNRECSRYRSTSGKGSRVLREIRHTVNELIVLRKGRHRRGSGVLNEVTKSTDKGGGKERGTENLGSRNLEDFSFTYPRLKGTWVGKKKEELNEEQKEGGVTSVEK